MQHSDKRVIKHFKKVKMEQEPRIHSIKHHKWTPTLSICSSGDSPKGCAKPVSTPKKESVDLGIMLCILDDFLLNNLVLVTL